MRRRAVILATMMALLGAGGVRAQVATPYYYTDTAPPSSPAAPVIAPQGTPVTAAPVFPGACPPGGCAAGACASPCGSDSCGGGCKLHPCHIDWLQPWTCDDLKMEPFEPKARYCGCKGLFWCPKEEEEEKKECATNGNGNGNGNGSTPAEEKKEGEGAANGNATANGNGTAEEKKEGEAAANGNGAACPEEEEEEGATTPLMQWMQCRCPKVYNRMEKRGDNLYGWLQMGYTANFDSPRDRRNFGTGYNWRSNDFQLNQLFLVYENTLEQDDTVNFGYHVSAMIGTDAPFNVQLGLFDDVVGTGQVNRIGFDLPQFYVEGHIPGFLGTKGMDIKVGKWYTLVNYEVIPATGNFFYSHSYTFFYGPFNCTGVLTTTHLTDTVDFYAGVFRGWEKFEDNNDRVSYTSALSWKSCDGRLAWFTAMQTGPEQDDDNGNYRTAVSSHITSIFGACNQWRTVLCGNYAIDSNAVTDDLGNARDALWYSTWYGVFYTVNPSFLLGTRAEWFRDEDGYRTGYEGTFYEVTMGANWFPYKNLRLRPELRFDWSPNATPFNDETDSFQTTAAIDLVWQF